MKKILLIGITIVIVIAVIVFLNKGYTSKVPTNSAPNPTNTVTGPNGVSIQNFSFNPGTLTVKVGTTVTWTNNDSATHSIKSTTFNSVNLSQNDAFKFTFDKSGTFNYSCGIHPTMTGTIIVQ